MLTCGYIGAGKMGGPMIERLLAAGTKVVLWGRSPEKLKRFEAAGATVAASAADLCRQVDVVITCVSDTKAMRAVVFEADGLAAGASAGKILIDMSTISPIEAMEMAETLATQTGMIWIDAPVSGGQAGAINGTLAVMAGGPADSIDSIRPLLAPLAQSVTCVGPSGAGQKAKMINQAFVSTMLVLLAEALNFAEKLGVDAKMIPEALRGGHADSVLLQRIWPRMVARDYTVTGTLDTVMKDLVMVQKLATDAAAPMPLTSLGAEMIRWRIHEKHGGDDIAALFKLYEQEAV